MTALELVVLVSWVIFSLGFVLCIMVLCLASDSNKGKDI